jgi:hypothetical protein
MEERLASSTRYKLNDLVAYGGYTYVCNTKHISGTQLTDNSGFWDTFNAGIVYKGMWSGSSVYYKLNDVVKHGANLWICTAAHTSTGTAIDTLKFSIFVNGFEFEDTWSGSTAYQIGDIVAYGGYTYTCIQNHTNQTPSTAIAYWKPFTTGFNFQGDWLVGTSYKVGDLVRLGGYTYVATADGAGNNPPNLSYWQRLNSGIKWNSTVGTYNSISSTNIISATGDETAEFNVVASGTTYAVTVRPGYGGTGYTNSDTLKILGTDVGGISPANDITLTVTGHSGGVITTVSASGISVTWSDGVTYVLGDVVFFGASSFICVDAHVSSDSTNRPDLDTTGEYWNLLASGTEQAVMTTQGDMFIFGENGPERLPAGTEGQILRVNNGLPAWSYYGLINNIVYVAPSGVDLYGEGQGLTIDKPWRTVRYACEQIEKGYLNPNASLLLAKNKQFIIKEVNNYIQYTYPGICDPVKTERDAGLVLDAIVYDLSHGGTSSTTIATLAYYNAAGTGYINSTVLAQINEFIDAQTYMAALIVDVLANDAPAINYQTLNSVAIPAEQIVDITLVSEDTATGIVTALSTIVIDGLGAGSTRTIAASIQPNTTVSVKTGTYNEVLPIVVPRNTAIVGDELRSTVVQPKAGISMLANDKDKTKSALTRIKDVIPDLILNNTITPTSGNTQVQDTSLPDGSVGDVTNSTKVLNTVNLITDILTNGFNEVPTFVFTNPTGYNSSLTNAAYASSGNVTGATLNYADGKAQIVQNYAFIKDEIAQYLTTFGSWTSYGADNQAKTLRDIGYILDAIQYDLTYGGNRQTLIAGRAYYSINILQISTTYLADTLAALARVKAIIATIATKGSVVVTPGNLTSQVTVGTAGSAGSGAFAQERIQDVIDWINNAEANATVEPYTAWASTALTTGFTALQNSRSEIASDAVVWIKKFYQATAFNQSLAERDAGDIVDAISYDLVLGSNFNAITAGRRYLSPVTSAQVVVNSLLEETKNSIKFIGWKARQLAAAGAVGQLQATIEDIINYIDGGAQPRFVWPDYAGVDAENAAAAKLIWINKGFIQAELIEYINTTYPLVEYSEEACSRDVGYIVDAVRYDMTYGGNFATRQAAVAYYSQLTSALQIDAADKTATLAAYAVLKTIMQDIANSGLSSYSATQVEVSYISGTGGDATSATTVGTLIQDMIDYIDDPVANPITESLASTSWVSSNLTGSNTSLQSAKTAIRASVISYIDTNYPVLDYDDTTCSRDVGYIVDAIGYDIMFGSNFRSIKAGMSYYQAQASLVIGSQKDATVAAFNYLKLQIEDVITDATSLASASKNMQIIIDILTNGVGETPEVHGTNYYNNTLSIIKGAEILRANREFLAYESTAWINNAFGGTVTTTTQIDDIFTTSTSHNLVAGDPVVFSGSIIANSGVVSGTTYYVKTTPSSTTFTLSSELNGLTINITSNGSGSMAVRYSYDADLCRRDMLAYVDALVYDLQFTGNYKSLRAAKLYNNAISGSMMENMFLVRNGTGLRNMTLSGLTGTLTNPNEYGTQRPTAGAYASLDPGFGPNDHTVWISSRSCYTQNCTMFGYACVGAKVDGSLHAGGYRSMVANDYTTIIGDGIGYWVTGSQALAELVSVFNYYGYAGYLAELGGRIRATNGNSSYGTYGVIAEGTDTFETPIYATLDNRAVEAFITNVVTDGTNEILRFEYANAGQNYTNSVPSINGSGYNAVAVQDEFRDSGVFETRIVNLNDGLGEGGTSYVTAANAAQTGDIASITIAATDLALTDSYNGMRIQIVAGTGVGQYANILTYANGTKIAQVWKDSFTNLTVTGSDAGANTLTVASTATLYVNMPIYLGTAIAGTSANTLYYVRAVATSTTFTIGVATTGGIFDITSTTTGQTVPLYAAGWDHVVPGITIAGALDLTTSYIIEPRIAYTAPGYTATARSMGATAQWQAATYGNNSYVAIANGSTATAYSTNGTSWASAGALNASTYVDVAYGGGEGAVATAVIGGLGGTGAVLEAVLGTGAFAGQVISINVINGGYNYNTVPTIKFSSGLAQATATVLDGAIATVTIDIPGSGYSSVPTVTAATSELTGITVSSWGKNYFSTPAVTIAPPFSATAWSSGASGTSGTYYSHLGNFYRATASGTFTTTGPTHTSGSITNGTVPLLYAGTQAVATANMTNYGVSSYTITDNGFGYTTIPAISVLDSSAKFVAIRSGASATSAYSTSANLGTSWTVGNTLASKTDLAALAYGGGVYVAVGGTSGTASAVSSTDGITWTDRSSAITALSGGSYSDVVHGNGTFLAIQTGGIATSYSSNGVTWTAGGNLPNVGSNLWTSIAYGNGRFVAIQGGASASTVVAYSLDKGVTWTQSPAGIGSSQTWTKIVYGQGLFLAIASGTTVCATSTDGINWSLQAMPGSSTNWKALAFGNISSNPLWIAASNTSGTIGASIVTGSRALARTRVVSNTITEVRMVEPGSGYPKGAISATTSSTNIITTADTTNLVALQPIEFTGLDSQGLVTNTTYYVVTGSIVTNTSFKVATNPTNAAAGTAVTLTTGTGLSGYYRAGPIITVTDPNNILDVNLRGRLGDGVLGNPSFNNRGANNSTATASMIGDGYSDIYQNSAYINVSGLYRMPTAGANVTFESITGSDSWYKLVSVTNILGVAGNYTATFQINPALTTALAPAHGNQITTRLSYSQVRLTGHDFLYIGTGNQSETNYPFVDPSQAIQANQQFQTAGGRVFFTSTDQDGNFNVGNLFGVQQSTGTATLDASAFNLSGLQSLQLGAVSLGVGSAVITQFSTDPYFTANSDSVVPTQRAIKAFITAQIGGGQSSLNVNTLTAGQIYIAGNSISNTTGAAIVVSSKMNFTGGIDGAPVALMYFGQR